MKHKTIVVKDTSFKSLTQGKVTRALVNDTASDNSKSDWIIYQITESGKNLLLFFRKK